MSFWATIRATVWKALGVGAYVAKWGVIAHCTLEYIGDFVICQGPSMEPTIRTSDIILTEHISTRYGWIQRGDIIITRSPHNPKQFICKRVVGLGGDSLLQYDGSILLIPKGYLWIEGDNERNSTDSRSYGPIPMGLVRGRALFRIWPFKDFKLLLPPPTTDSQSNNSQQSSSNH